MTIVKQNEPNEIDNNHEENNNEVNQQNNLRNFEAQRVYVIVDTETNRV